MTPLLSLLMAYALGLLLSGACLLGIRVTRLVCRLWGVGLSVVSGSWIALVPW